MKTLSIAVIGTNFISDRFVQAAKAVAGVRVLAVLSRTEERAKEFAAQYGIERAYHELSVMLSDSDIDAVYVATPNYTHKDFTLSALKAGKHVLLEKPVTENLDDFLLLRRESDALSLVLLEAMRPDFDPAIRIVKENLGLVGTVRRASLEYCQYSSRYDKFKEGIVERAFDPAIGNSALADIGIYPLHVCISLFGEPTDVVHRGIRLSNGFLGGGTLLLDYASRGFIADISYSKIVDSNRASVIDGELGTLEIDKINGTQRVVFHPRGGQGRVLYSESVENNMIFEIDAFAQMVRGELCHTKYLDQTEMTMRVYDSAFISSRPF